MKYELNGMVNGRKNINKTFKTRNKADNYLSKLLISSNLEVNDVYEVNNNKHNIAYVCNDYNRFSIRRV